MRHCDHDLLAISEAVKNHSHTLSRALERSRWGWLDCSVLTISSETNLIKQKKHLPIRFCWIRFQKPTRGASQVAACFPELAGRRAFLTGGGTGIGLSIARALAAQGVAVALADIDVAAAERAAHAKGRARWRSSRCAQAGFGGSGLFRRPGAPSAAARSSSPMPASRPCRRRWS